MLPKTNIKTKTNYSLPPYNPNEIKNISEVYNDCIPVEQIIEIIVTKN